MKLNTALKRLEDIVQEGLLPVAEAADSDIMKAEAACALEAALELTKRIEGMRLIQDTEGLSRINRLSKRIFLRDDFTCQVCGIRDTTCEDLSRVTLVKKDSYEDRDYITLCKEHMKELKRRIPWKERNDREEVIEVLEDMISEENGCT